MVVVSHIGCEFSVILLIDVPLNDISLVFCNKDARDLHSVSEAIITHDEGLSGLNNIVNNDGQRSSNILDITHLGDEGASTSFHHNEGSLDVLIEESYGSTSIFGFG